MALSGSVKLPEDLGRVLKIEFKNNGQELYWLDDELVNEVSGSGLGKSGVRKIPVDDHDVEFRFSFSGKDSYGDVYIDNTLYKKDLFSIQGVVDGNAPKGLPPFLILLIVLVVMVILFAFL